MKKAFGTISWTGGKLFYVVSIAAGGTIFCYEGAPMRVEFICASRLAQAKRR